MQSQNNESTKAQSVKLSGRLVRDAEIRAKQFNRSKAGQLEFWARIGKIAEENPDINFELIRQILISKEELGNGETKPFSFSSKDINGPKKRKR